MAPWCPGAGVACAALGGSCEICAITRCIRWSNGSSWPRCEPLRCSWRSRSSTIYAAVSSRCREGSSPGKSASSSTTTIPMLGIRSPVSQLTMDRLGIASCAASLACVQPLAKRARLSALANRLGPSTSGPAVSSKDKGKAREVSCEERSAFIHLALLLQPLHRFGVLRLGEQLVRGHIERPVELHEDRSETIPSAELLGHGDSDLFHQVADVLRLLF